MKTLRLSAIVAIGLLLVPSEQSFAQVTTKGITFQGVIKLPDNTYPNLMGQTINMKVLSPNGCVLREETFNGVEIKNGYLTVTIGRGNPAGFDPLLPFEKIFDNSQAISHLVCLDTASNTTSDTDFNPTLHGTARKARLTVASLDIIADFNLRAVPFAMESETLGGKKAADFIHANVNLTQTFLDSLVANTGLQGLLGGSLPLSVMGSGTPSGTTFLRGDGTWAAISAGSTSADDITSGTLALARGGTGATTASAARTNLGLATIASSGSASDLSTGTVATARLGSGTASGSTFLRGDGTWATAPATTSADDLTSGTLALARGGTGATTASAARTNLGLATIASSGSASDLSSGTVATARLGSGTASGSTFLRGDGAWSVITFPAPAAGDLTGTVAIANGGTGATTASAARTNLGLATIASSGSASDLSTGTVATARLGSGTASGSTFLRGDGTWAAPTASAVISGPVTTPSISVSGYSNTGFYSGGNEIGVAVGGISHSLFTNEYIMSYRKIAAANGGRTTPHFAFALDLDTGIYNEGGNKFAIAIDSVATVRINAGTMHTAASIIPETNNARDLGTDTLRWRDIYSVNAVTTSSDKRLKKDIQDSDLGLDFINSLTPVSWLWNTQDSDERHYGLIAQELETTIKDKQSKRAPTSIISHNPKTDTYGVRYTELIAPIIKAIQELFVKTQEIDQLKAENELMKKWICDQDPTAVFCK